MCVINRQRRQATKANILYNKPHNSSKIVIVLRSILRVEKTKHIQHVKKRTKKLRFISQLKFRQPWRKSLGTNLHRLLAFLRAYETRIQLHLPNVASISHTMLKTTTCNFSDFQHRIGWGGKSNAYFKKYKAEFFTIQQ